MTILLGHSVNFLAEILKSLVEALSKLTLLLLVVHLVGIVHAPTRIANCLARINHFREKLNVAVLFLSNHDRILQMKMDQHHDFALARLEDCVLDVIVHDINDLASVGYESQAVRVGLKVALSLASSDDGTHRQIGKSRDSLVLCADELFLFDESGLLFSLNFPLTRALSQLGNLTEGLYQKEKWKQTDVSATEQ